MDEMMDEVGFETVLREAIEMAADDTDDGELALTRVETFEEHGVLARNRGLVVRLQNGQKFQLTIVEA